MPALKPVNTGREMKLARNPSRRNEASNRKTPTRKASVAAGMMYASGSAWPTTRASSEATSIEMVDVLLTLSGREVPRKA
jgi:hypothetical protein